MCTLVYTPESQLGFLNVAVCTKIPLYLQTLYAQIKSLRAVLHFLIFFELRHNAVTNAEQK